MGKGVTETQIHAAADALLTAGERPTVERVRLALGRGSPNAIGPVLDGWWGKLSQRVAHRLALPDAPDAVGEAFAQAWAIAVASGQAYAEAQVAPERAALAETLAQVDADAASQRATVADLEQQLQRAQTTLQATEAALGVSDQRVGDLRREISAFESRLQDLSDQREALDTRLRAALLKADADRAAAATEREALQALLRQVEDRAYGEVDRHRQELKTLKSQAIVQTREHASALRSSDQARRHAEMDLQKSQREVATLRARCAALTASRSKPAPPKARASVRRRSGTGS